MTKFLHLNDANKTITKFEEVLSGVRAGRVNASILDTITVEAYGQKMGFKELATISSPEPMQLMITPFDKGLIQDIAKAITQSNLGVNPVDDGAGVRLSFPPLTEEQRLEKQKEVNKMLEEYKVRIRKERGDMIRKWKHMKEEEELGEDDVSRNEKQLQTEVDDANKQLDALADAKKEELLKI